MSRTNYIVTYDIRDPKRLRSMMAESARLHAALLKDWQKLSVQYKNALAEITSIAAWEKTFAAHSEKNEN